ncbi:hypothetical protein VTK73DRAFT_605 [Phialemonium thermophilum]|uniref:Trafficking protein particle complex subunit n=1 Tax=Phialemonium thermophilum TaxID=223376 RepID=A0ABR3XDI3_9PEZI
MVINKAGGTIYNRNFHEGGLRKISANEYLVLGGTFHGVYAITARLNPLLETSSAGDRTSLGSNHGGGAGPAVTVGGLQQRPEPLAGLEVLESENFRMQCFNTMTGTKFLLFTDTTQTNVDGTVRRIYDLYADYVMKNPFYQLEMPIRCDMFDRKLASYIREVNNR